MVADFIGTIESDDEESLHGESSRAPRTPARDEELDLEFHFEADGGRSEGIDLWGGDEVKEARNGAEPIGVDDIIARRTGRAVQPYQERKRKRDDANGDDGASTDDDDGESEAEIDEDEDEEDDVIEAEEDESEGMFVDEDEDEEMDESGESEAGGLKPEDGQNEDVEGSSDEPSSEDDADDASDREDAAETARKDAFFSQDPTPELDPTTPTSFSSMNLSRPLLRALTSLSLTIPTPIQARAIPLALLGRDILGSAVTGSGKTAAFMIPVLERLCYRDRGKGGQACRVLVLCPTRELAVQCEAVGRALAEKGGMDVRFALLVGGLSLNAQAHALRTLPDILIATPGRLIDHLTNTPSFTLSALDVLVIDEADRMLEAGFTDELEEIIKACPRSRQTMLFSATMTDSVDELVKLSLNKPIRVFVDPKRNTAKSLTQEFVRIRTDETRSPSLLALCKRTVRERCIVFFRSKALAHQMRVVFGLCGLKAAELHGNLTQEQRLQALNDFKAGRVDYLLATDLASRGLDIKGVETVINYDMPGQLSQYTHRVGRTARAGRKGRSISLVGEADRKMLKAAIKQSQADQIRHRIIPSEAVAAMSAKLDALKDEIQEVLKEEKEEKVLRQADMEIRKGENMVEHEAEIYARPARTWFQSEREKQAAKDASKSAYVDSFPAAKKDKAGKDDKPVKRGKYDGLSRKVKRRKMANEEDAREGRAAATAAAIRAAKKGARPVKITEALPMREKRKGGKKGESGGGKKGSSGPKGSKKSAFDEDRGGRERGAGGGGGGKTGGRHEGMRAKPVKVNLAKKGKGGGKTKGKGRR